MAPRPKAGRQASVGFDPHRMVVWTDAPARLLRGEDLVDQFRHTFDAHVFLLDDDHDWPEVRPDPKDAAARVSWEVLRYDVLVNAGLDPRVFADDTSADLGHLSYVLLDEHGILKEDLRSQFGETGFGGALLYIDAIEILHPQVDVYAMSVELMEHVIRHYTAGCFGAVYFRGVQEMPNVGIERALRFLSFKKVGDEPIYFVNLEHRRPELPDYR